MAVANVAQVEPPVFVVGATRSGTTLLGLMMDHHSQMAFAGELEWMFDRIPRRSDPPFDDYYEWLSTNRIFRWHQLKVDRSLPWDALLRSFLDQMKRDAGPHKPHAVASVHRNVDHAMRLWPNARFVQLVRDGRDVCASWIRHGWHGNGWSCALAWTNSLKEWQKVRQSVPEARRLEVRFEDLVTDPPSTLRRITAFVGCEYEPGMLEYPKHTTYEAVDPDQTEKWRTELPEREVRIFESIAGDALQAHGYALSGLPPIRMHRPRRIALDVESKLRRNRAQLRQVGATLWAGDQLARRLKLKGLHRSVQLRINNVINSSLK